MREGEKRVGRRSSVVGQEEAQAADRTRAKAGIATRPTTDDRRPTIPINVSDGGEFDLANVTPGDIVWTDIANALSKQARFNGCYREPGIYSIAQHCVMGADALMAETGDHAAAAYFLLHDAHEGPLGDFISPVVKLLDAELTAACGTAPGAFRAVLAAVKRRIDLPIWQAAGIAPIDRMPLYARQVEDMDARMLRVEAIALFGPKAAATFPKSAPPRLTGAIKPWGPVKAEIAWLDRLERYLGIVARVG